MIPLKEWALNNGINPSTARQKANRGTIPAFKMGRDWFIDDNVPNFDKRRKNVEKS